MNLFNAPEFKVGFLVLVVSALIGGMSMKVSEDPSYLGGKAQQVWFLVNDATGLVSNSVVKLAGVNVGVIKRISLEGQRARILLSIQGHIPLTTSSSVKIKALGFLGDKMLELDLGNSSDPRIGDGAQIRNASESGSVDVIMDQVTQISESLADISDSIRDATTGPGNPQHPLGRIIRNVEKLTGDMASLVGDNKGKLGDLVSQFVELSEKLNQVLGETEEDGFRAAWKDAVSSLKRIEKTLGHVESIASKVDNGKGAVGRLINDDTVVEELTTTMKGVNELLETAKKVQTSIDFHSEYFGSTGQTKSFLGVKVQPGLDRYYEIAIVDDPDGVSETKDETVTTGGNSTSTNTVTTFQNKVKVTALFAKNFYDFTIKGGLIENEGGVGMDYHLFRKRLRLSLEAFNFENLNLRAFARYDVWKGIYLVGGGENVSNSGTTTAFMGAGIFITNDDLKLLLSGSPIP